MTDGKRKKPKNNHLEEYSRVVGAAELEAVNLLSLNFAVQPKFFAERENLELGYDIDVSGQQYDEEGDKAVAFIDCSVTAGANDEEIFKCEAKYIVVYSLNEKCAPDAVEVFLRRVAVFACYPYFRAVVANMDWSAATHLPPMPVHREVKSKPPKALAADVPSD